MAKNESSKSKAEVYREERKARIAKAAKQNAKGIQKRSAAANILKKVVAVVLAVAIVGGVAWKIVDNLGLIEKMVTAVNIGDTKISAAEFNYYYSAQYQQMAYYAEQYAQMGMNMGFDSSLPPDEQDSTEKDEDGNVLTWAESLENSAVNYAQYVVAYYEKAIADGYELTEDEKAELNETIETYRDQAAQNNYSLNAYLRESFGPGFNEKTFKKQIEMETIAQRYRADQEEKHKTDITDEEVKAEYDANRKEYDYADLRYFAFPFTTLSGEEGETEDALAARQKKANDEVIAKAKAVFANITDEASFKAAVTAYKNEGSKTPTETDFTSVSKNATYSSFVAATSEDAADWAFDVARKAGDKNVIAGEKAAYIVYCIKPLYTMNTVDVRHCLVQFDAKDSSNITDEEKKAAYTQAKALYDEWLAGDKTEESFIAMVKESTDDTASKETGGIYEGIRITDNYVEAFEAWSFDPARKAGDTGIVETEHGYHIMYFVKNNAEDVDWKFAIRETKGSEAFTAFDEELLKEDGEYAINRNDTWVNMVSKDFCDKIRKNKAYSSNY